MEDFTQEPEKRVETLNRQLRSQARGWRLLSLSLVLVLGGGSIGAAARWYNDSIEAKQFLLRGDDGKTRAIMAVRQDGSPGLALLDDAGRMRAALEVSKTGLPSLTLYGPGGGHLVAVAVRSDGTPGMALFSQNENGRLRASLDVLKDGGSGVNLYGATGVLRAAVAVRGDGTPAVGLFDESGRNTRSFEAGR